MWIGLLAVIMASIFFGSVFVPVKKIAAGDGFTAQLFLCLGAVFTSAVVHVSLGFPALHELAIIGGILWATANAFAIQIMNRLGMALSMLVWNTISCLTGWATSRYGLLGLPAAEPASSALNYIGIMVLIIGGATYMFVKNNTQTDTVIDTDLIDRKKLYALDISTDKEGTEEISVLERIGSFAAAMLCGICYGSMWIPVNYIKNHPEKFPNAPNESLPFLFSFFVGVLCTSIVIFLIYSLILRNNPWVNSEAALPSMASGVIFAVGMTSFVVAIDKLEAAVAYPICSMAPGLVVSLWSILYFREITGRRNLILLCIAYGFTLIGVTLVTISKEVSLS
ncbi:hypothetical protein DICVIV_07728 [Dictyocaulus viviparus]|uniref:Transmembrane protein 144 n=1 Tax=Dictyocaulus viviparus TaxID=29172 RepID=A0A0D8XNL4_DICVI|nr:hypothetical protein DICVIV_07728 [Dictyocaulus viviparus]